MSLFLDRPELAAVESLTKLEIAYKLITDVELVDYSEDLNQIVTLLQQHIAKRTGTSVT